jgi:serine/threonine protein kinase/Flp pilus assembly protein TadD
MTERTIFLAVLEIEDPSERSAYLDRACAGDPALRAQVEQLLKAHREPGRFMEHPAPALLASAGEPPAPERPGTVIGPYRLMEQIGEGGMGLVFVAEQQHPVRRKVAVKVIRPGMDTREVIARFEAERQALALMDHPNIARVLDAGATESGRPYFVMELVKGVPITQFCDENCRTPRERLELFVSVCQAVQHAHQKGIIHRDLKATNILVTLHDGTPVVKVIDFGIAKATGQQLTDKTIYTRFTQLIGTPSYMSPEQAQLSSLDIDTRSDIYSLGVLLYELLTGTTPFDRERLQTVGYDEIRRIIREEEPARPSARISTLLGETLTVVSAQRKTDPKRLGQLFRGELDWIVMKALEKERSRRYESASAFAADVQRYLADEPVQACPPSAWYRFRKLARRNKRAFVATAALALAVLLGVVGLAASNVMIRQEQGRAEKAQKLAEDRAEEIRKGLERLKAANALLERGRWYVNERRWDDANAAFTEALRLRPDHASVWDERSDLYARLGLWDLVAADIARGLEIREPDTPWRWARHAQLRIYVGDREGYRLTCRRMRERFRGTLNNYFVIEVVRTCVLAPDPDTDLAGLVGLSKLVADQPHPFAYSLFVLGTAHYRTGKYEQAVRRLRQALAADPEWARKFATYPVLAMACHRLGQQAEARKALDEAARALERWTQERYQTQGGYWVFDRGATGTWPLFWWDWVEYELYYREARVLIDGAPPADDPRLHVLRARSFAGLRQPDKAAAEYAAALKMWPKDPQVRLEAHRNQAFYHIGRGQWSQAAAEFARARELRPGDTILACYGALARFVAGEVDTYRKDCAALMERYAKTEHPGTACDMLLACVLRDDALPDRARLLPLARVAARHFHYGSWTRGAALYRAGKYDEAVRCFETAAKTYRPRAWEWCFLAMAHHRLGHAGEARRCLAEAARWIDEANRRKEDDPSGLRPTWGSWHESVVYPLLLREAEELVK